MDLVNLTYLSDALCSLSSSSVAIGTGAKSLTASTGKAFAAGEAITISRTDDESFSMSGTVTSYNSGTGALVVDITSTAGAGTFAAWTIRQPATLRYSEAGYVSKPADTPANTHWAPRLLSAGTIRRSMWEDGGTRGKVGIGTAAFELVNGDNALNALLAYGWDGQPVSLRTGEVHGAYSSFTEIFAGYAEQPGGSASQPSTTITISARDKMGLLNRPLLRETYTGGNTPPNGIEGNQDDIGGKPKPHALGICRNLEPYQVNTSKDIYQFTLSGIGPGAVVTVKDMGVALTRGADYPDQATMESTAPSAGQYRVWSAGGCFRLGSAPAGKITVDLTNPVWRYASWPFTVDTATEQVTAATTGFVTGDPVNFHVTDTTGVLPAPLVAGTTYYARVISSGGGSTVLTLHPTSGDSVANTNVVNLTTAGTASFLGSRDNASTSIYALLWELWRLGTGNTTVGTNTLSNNITGGIYLKDQINLLDAMDMLADGCNAWYSAPAGALNLTVFEAPSGSAALDLAEADINKLVLRAAAGPTRGLPVHRVSVTYKKNWTVMRPAELAGGVTPAERTFAGLEFRTAVWNEPTGLVKALNAAAPELQVTSYMDSKGRADAEAARLGALHGVRRQTFEVEVEDTAAALAVGLGDVIRITHSAYSLSAALFRVIGLALDRAAGTITFTVWG